MLMAARTQSLPRGSGVWGCDVLAMSNGIPFLLGSFSYLCDEVWELLGFGGVELSWELLLKWKCVDCLV